jgi:hypothetical protein
MTEKQRCPDCGGYHESQDDKLAQAIMKTVTTYFETGAVSQDGRKVSGINCQELGSSLARIVGFLAAAAPDPGEFMMGFMMETAASKLQFSNPAHPNNPSKIFDAITHGTESKH